MTVLPDQDDGSRLGTGEAQQFDRAAADLGLHRRLVPPVAVIADHHDLSEPVEHRFHQVR